MEFWVSSYPRAGNLFFRTLLRIRYGVVSLSDRPGTPVRYFPNSTIFRPEYRDENSVAGIQGMKTHLPPDPADHRQSIYIVRDGRESLVSYGHHALVPQVVFEAP